MPKINVQFEYNIEILINTALTQQFVDDDNFIIIKFESSQNCYFTI